MYLTETCAGHGGGNANIVASEQVGAVAFVCQSFGVARRRRLNL